MNSNNQTEAKVANQEAVAPEQKMEQPRQVFGCRFFGPPHHFRREELPIFDDGEELQDRKHYHFTNNHYFGHYYFNGPPRHFRHHFRHRCQEYAKYRQEEEPFKDIWCDFAV